MAQHARALAPADHALSEQLFRLLMQSGRWAEAQELLQDAKRHKAITGETLARYRALVLNERARQAERDGEGQQALSFAREAVAFDPRLADAVLRLSRLQAAQGQQRAAVATLDKAWRLQPLPHLAEAWIALMPSVAPLQRLRRLDKLAASQPDVWVTQRIMGEAALEAKLWGQARKYLTAAAAIRPTASLLGLLARLETNEYQDQTAAQKWLATPALADPAWQCQSCGSVHQDWSALCPQCAALDRLTWPEINKAPTAEVF